MFRERERLGAHHVVTGVLNFCEAIEMTSSKSNLKTLKIRWKYVYKFEKHDIELRSWIVMII